MRPHLTLWYRNWYCIDYIDSKETLNVILLLENYINYEIQNDWAADM